MKKNIFFTQWINLILLFIVACISYIIDGYEKDYVVALVIKAPFAIILSLIWLSIIIVPFLLLYFIIEGLFVKFFLESKKLRKTLLIEWIIISLPLVYCAVNYPNKSMRFIVIIMTLLIGQLLREKPIQKIINSNLK